jgi:hypothetical protein
MKWQWSELGFGNEPYFIAFGEIEFQRTCNGPSRIKALTFGISVENLKLYLI